MGGFGVISESRLRAIESARGRTKSRLALAVMYAREGLMEEAGRELGELDGSEAAPGVIEKLKRRTLPDMKIEERKTK